MLITETFETSIDECGWQRFLFRNDKANHHQPRMMDLTSDLKSLTFITYISMCILLLCSGLGSDLIELRMTWREMENLIFGRIIRILEGFLKILGEILRKKIVSCKEEEKNRRRQTK